MDIRPYHMVEGDGFRHLAQALINVGAKHGSVRAEDVLPSDKTVGRYTKEAAEDLRSKLKSQFKEVCTYLYSELLPKTYGTYLYTYILEMSNYPQNLGPAWNRNSASFGWVQHQA